MSLIIFFASADISGSGSGGGGVGGRTHPSMMSISAGVAYLYVSFSISSNVTSPLLSASMAWKTVSERSAIETPVIAL